MDMSLNKLQEVVKEREAWRAAVMGSQSDMIELLNNFTNCQILVFFVLLIWFKLTFTFS